MTRKPSLEEQMIAALMQQKEKYEDYLSKDKGEDYLSKDKDQGEVMDHKAEHAYTGIIKAIFELSRKSKKETTDPEEMKRLAKEILESDFGIKR